MRVAVTGTDDRLAERLRADEFEVVSCPLVRIEELEGPLIDGGRYDWIVVTSRNAVAPLVARLTGRLPKVAAIGPGTAEGLRAAGLDPDLVAPRSTQEGVADALPDAPGRVLHAGAEGARDVLVRELGAELVPLYRTVELAPGSFPDADLVTLASASAARALASLRTDLPCVSIGPVTSETLREFELTVDVQADEFTIPGLIKAIAEYAKKNPLTKSSTN